MSTRCLIQCMLIPQVSTESFNFGSALNRKRCFVSAHLREERSTAKHMLFPDTASDNDGNIDYIHEKLCSPAPDSYRVINLAAQRISNVLSNNHDDCLDDDSTSQIVADIASLTYLVKPGYRLVVYRMRNSATANESEQVTGQSDGVQWDVLSVGEAAPIMTKDDLIEILYDGDERTKESQKTVLDLAHDALDLVTEASETGIAVNQTALDAIVGKVKRRLEVTQGTDLRGRMSADAAFCLALAGIHSPPIFDSLLQIATSEIGRFGKRASCKPKYILHMMEKLAATGAFGAGPAEGSPFASPLFRLAAECLEDKGFDSNLLQLLKSRTLELHSEESLLWLWRFSARQMKPTQKKAQHALGKYQTLELPKISFSNDDKWYEQIFDDTKKPLILDIGCGMGVSLLGLATLADPEHVGRRETTTPVDLITWSKCNFLGVDMSHLFIGYANGITKRWGIHGKNIHFIRSPAQKLLDNLQSKPYPGGVQLIMIQFPTPYQLDDCVSKDLARSGNANNPQLPKDMNSGFMVTPTLLKTASTVLCQQDNGESGYLLLQSNCEDVAITLRRQCIDSGLFHVVDVPLEDTVTEPVAGRKVPRRTLDWLESLSGGKSDRIERACGYGWSCESLLPSRGATETEVSCLWNGTPIHRCLLQAIQA